MVLKSIVDELLKKESRSMIWLSVAMAKVLPATFFQTEVTTYNNKTSQSLVGDQKGEYSDLKNSLKNCKEILTTLKDQIKAK